MSGVKREINLNDFGKIDMTNYKRLKSTANESNESSAFAPGAIIKVSVKNFVTYASTEFTLSPSLNMIIGPNGAGKSTFVCAVCLGLGGHPTLLGRQKTLSGFIKNGEDSGSIEITLKNESGKENVIITRQLYQNNKSDWQLNRVHCTESKVKQTLQVFNIQLDNLCQFLPQEKVADFAKSSPEDILLETQRAIDIKLLGQHKELISLDNERLTLRHVLDSKQTESLKLSSEKAHYEEEAKKYAEFQKKKAELDHHEKLLPYAQMEDLKQEVNQLKAARDEIKAKLNAFNEQAAPFNDFLDNFDRNIDRLLNISRDEKQKRIALQTSINQQQQQVAEADKKHKKLLATIEQYENKIKDAQRRLEVSQAHLEEAQIEQDQLQLPDPKELGNIRERINELHDQRTNLQTQLQGILDEINRAKNQIQRAQSRITQLQEQLRSKDRIYIFDTDRNRRNQQSGYTKRAVQLLRTQLKGYRTEVFEPPCLTVSAKRQEYAYFLEELLDYNTSMSFTAVNSDAYDRCSKELMGDHNLNVAFRYLNNKRLEGDIPSEQLKRMGFDGYLRDFLEGPEPVIQMLSEQSFIHDIPVAIKPLSDSQIEDLRTPRNGRLIFRKFFSGDTLYNLSSSRYGSRQVIVRTMGVKKNLNLFSSDGISEERKQEIHRAIRQHQDDAENWKSTIPPIEEKRRSIGAQLEEVEGEYQDLDTAFKEANKIKKNFDKLKARIDSLIDKCEGLKKEANVDVSADIGKFKRRINAVYLEKLSLLAKLVKAQCGYNEISKEITLLEVRIFEEKNKKISVKNMTKALEDEKVKLKREYDEAKRRIQEFKNSDLMVQIKRRTDTYSEELKEKLADYITTYKAQEKFSATSITDMIESISAELALLGSSSKSSVNRLETIVNQLVSLEAEIKELDDLVEHKETEITKIHAEWEPKLLNLIGKISEKFSSIFPTVGVAGEVRVTKKEKYEEWRLEILVKFREESDLKVLDSHTQSGGERAVSTVYYMISLQELTSSPFRVVDEINQGMDARNERIVHKHMVETACRENTSQYFLITPKLLTNLHYAENMRIHCIMAGPWTPNTRDNNEYLSLGTTSLYAY